MCLSRVSLFILSLCSHCSSHYTGFRKELFYTFQKYLKNLVNEIKRYDSFVEIILLFQSNKMTLKIIAKFKPDLHIKVNLLVINVKPTGLFLL